MRAYKHKRKTNEELYWRGWCEAAQAAMEMRAHRHRGGRRERSNLTRLGQQRDCKIYRPFRVSVSPQSPQPQGSGLLLGAIYLVVVNLSVQPITCVACPSRHISFSGVLPALSLILQPVTAL